MGQTCKQGEHMICGVGIDSVDIEEMARILIDTDGLPSSFCKRTFSEAERAEADARYNKASVYAGKFAVKEACFKAVAPLTPEGFDFRYVECLEDKNGAPHIHIGAALQAVFDEVGIAGLLCSITNEKGLATAIVLAQSKSV